jgi:hypothetical protein
MPVQTRCNLCGDSSPPGLDAVAAREWLITHNCRPQPKSEEHAHRARRGRVANMEAKTPPFEGK